MRGSYFFLRAFLCSMLAGGTCFAALKKVSENEGRTLYTFTQPLLHTSPSAGTFEQRVILVKNPAAKADAKILIESSHIFTSRLEELAKNQFNAFAKPLTAHLVLVEHRFTGGSGVDASKELSTILPYLGADEVANDLSRVQDALTEELQLKGKWLALGGSYTAALALNYAELFPGKLVGVYASSPSHLNAGAYTSKPVDKMVAIHGEKCVQKIDGLVKWVTKELEGASPDDISKFAKEVFGTKATVTDVQSILETMGTAAYTGVGPEELPNSFCQYLEGALSHPNPDYRAALGGMMNRIKTDFGDAFVFATPGAFEGMKANAPQPFRLGAIWKYTVCQELGTMWVASATGKLLSPRVNSEYRAESCQKVFGIDPDTRPAGSWLGQKIVKNLGSAQNALIIDGGRDPWSLDWLIESEHARIAKNAIYFRSRTGTHCAERSAFFPTDQQVQGLVIKTLNTW